MVIPALFIAESSKAYHFCQYYTGFNKKEIKKYYL